MVLGGIGFAIILQLVAPFFIITSTKKLFGKSYINTLYGVAALFVPPLVLLYCFYNWGHMRKPIALAFLSFSFAIMIFIVRSLTLFYCPV